MSNESKSSRREFLKNAAVVTASAAAAGALGAWNFAPAPIPDKWDKEVDVVVVGSGSGLTGALAAAAAGAKVLVLEKMSFAGGSTGMSGGLVWVPNNNVMKKAGYKDSREDALTYLRLVAGGAAEEDIIQAFLDKGPEMIDFVAANSPIEWVIEDFLGYKQWEYHPEWPGAAPKGRSVWPKGDAVGVHGPLLTQGLVKGIQSKGAELLLNTTVQSLITRMLPDGRQEVLGVVAKSGDKTINVKATKGVLLTAGGYDWNYDMVKTFLRGPAKYTIGVAGDTGDGILMAMAVGAGLANMNECWASQYYKEPSEAVYKDKKMATGADRGRPGSIMVNRYGERFMNEAGDYDSSNAPFWYQENWGQLRYHNLPAFTIMDNKCKTKYGMGGANADKPVAAWVKQANTLADLAKALGVDPAGLEKTVADFNANAKQGKDPQFHRGESLYDRKGLYCDGSIEGAGATLGALDTPPFYAAEVYPGFIGTCGGAKVNVNAQVLTPFGQVIPRLYAAGNNSGIGGPGANYGAGGGTIGPAMAFSYIAGKHVVTLEAWKPSA